MLAAISHDRAVELELGFLSGAVIGWALYYVGMSAWILFGEHLRERRPKFRP
jgi:hypothetical protein